MSLRHLFPITTTAALTWWTLHSHIRTHTHSHSHTHTSPHTFPAHYHGLSPAHTTTTAHIAFAEHPEPHPSSSDDDEQSEVTPVSNALSVDSSEYKSSFVLSPEEASLDTDWSSAYARCEKMKKKALSYSRRVKFMIQALSDSGCRINGEEFIQCELCEARVSAALYDKGSSDGKGESDVGVVVCVNTLGSKSQDYFDTFITHELIHAFDVCRAYTDFDDLRHQACTEVRAANLSGECTFRRELRRGYVRFIGHHPVCVKRRAIVSVLGNPTCNTPEDAADAVDLVFDRCYRDVQPFGSIPW